ncbi:MAG: polymer-forming cytoskeletal protein [Deltaproteobacteria bacterium]|nr:polymer-forming cytoskeletal protein [Deltaproteobacteria bacterium]MBN2671434.1 polymer-forming cytoskeletal protein [Deltaproteobacteria bacterium]
MADKEFEVGSLLGKGATFTGKLTFFGTVRIEGCFEGEVVSDDTLVIAPGGEVRGKIQVGHLVVTGGVVDAEVIARESVEILPDGKLVGEVTTPSFQIEKGAVFMGTSKMVSLEEDSESPEMA